ncbi:DUF1772 domain-containing protein [Actinomadura barringtoniae]|uniref:DUF1772 domain-containing protein n=1 Tax=Actinomadura barringtoniae TaxID=1427535 RepID=A0A939PBF3_9ACTN|nr:anthrone oxygenase family protein [Actinomadura barringtoniae]MBO2449712.1 DUF1772 domain-containing protein [Actinomadura barringtoniae]
MTNTRLVAITRWVSLLGGGVLSGIALTVLVLELAMRRLGGPAYVQVRQAEYGYLTWFISAVFVPTLIAVVMLVVIARRTGSPAFRPAVVALVLLVLALLITVVVNGPINFEQIDWNARTPPPDWAEVRDRWQIAHAIRTVLIAIASGFLCVAVLGRPFARPPVTVSRSVPG